VFEALLKRMTVMELFMSTILKSREQFIESGAIARLSTDEQNRHNELLSGLDTPQF
jgi:hypothetical protein